MLGYAFKMICSLERPISLLPLLPGQPIHLSLPLGYSAYSLPHQPSPLLPILNFLRELTLGGLPTAAGDLRQTDGGGLALFFAPLGRPRVRYTIVSLPISPFDLPHTLMGSSGTRGCSG